VVVLQGSYDILAEFVETGRRREGETERLRDLERERDIGGQRSEIRKIGSRGD